MIEIKLDLKILKALLITAGKNDIRQYLNSIAIKNGYMVSTDGHRLLRYKLDIDPSITTVIPRMAIESTIQSARIFKPTYFNELVLELENNLNECSITMRKGENDYLFKNSFKLIDANLYPDPEKIFSNINTDDSKIKPSTFDAKYLADIEKILKEIGSRFKAVKIITNGMGAAYIHLGSSSSKIEMEMLLMPLNV